MEVRGAHTQIYRKELQSGTQDTRLRRQAMSGSADWFLALRHCWVHTMAQSENHALPAAVRSTLERFRRAHPSRRHAGFHRLTDRKVLPGRKHTLASHRPRGTRGNGTLEDSQLGRTNQDRNKSTTVCMQCSNASCNVFFDTGCT